MENNYQSINCTVWIDKCTSEKYFLSVIHTYGKQVLMYANIRRYGNKYLHWVSYINCIMYVYRIYQECLYVDFASGTSTRPFLCYINVFMGWRTASPQNITSYSRSLYFEMLFDSDVMGIYLLKFRELSISLYKIKIILLSVQIDIIFHPGKE